MPKEIFQFPGTFIATNLEKSAQQIDSEEQTIPKVALEDMLEGEKVKYAFVDTGIRSTDGKRYQYVLVHKCTYKEVQRYLSELKAGQITDRNVHRRSPAGSSLYDIVPMAALPRIGYSTK